MLNIVTIIYELSVTLLALERKKGGFMMWTCHLGPVSEGVTKCCKYPHNITQLWLPCMTALGNLEAQYMHCYQVAATTSGKEALGGGGGQYKMHEQRHPTCQQQLAQ